MFLAEDGHRKSTAWASSPSQRLEVLEQWYLFTSNSSKAGLAVALGSRWRPRLGVRKSPVLNKQLQGTGWEDQNISFSTSDLSRPSSQVPSFWRDQASRSDLQLQRSQRQDPGQSLPRPPPAEEGSNQVWEVWSSPLGSPQGLIIFSPAPSYACQAHLHNWLTVGEVSVMNTNLYMP